MSNIIIQVTLICTVMVAILLQEATSCPYLKERHLQDVPPRGGQDDERDGRNGGRGPGGRNVPDGRRGRPNGRGGRGAGNGGILAVDDATPVEGLTVTQALAQAKSDIQSIMNGNRAAEFIRLAFHDCVGGECDGCVDTSRPDNFGLDEPIENLEGIVIAYNQTLTRADVWVLAALTAAEETQQTNTPVPFEMQFIGRPVCADSRRGPDRDMPSAHITSGDLIEFFGRNFQFSERDTAAIIGAHTLGRAIQQNSGFNGNQGWVRNQNRLDNQFYNVLLDGDDVDPRFELELQENDGNPFPDQFLWRRGNSNDFMLNVDMALAKDLDGFVDPTSGGVSCTLNESCPDSPLLTIAAEYADSNELWLSDFLAAFQKMTTVGCPGVCTPV